MNSCEYKQGMRLEGPVCLTIGKFDGLHLGHMSVIGPRPQLVRDMVFMTDEQRRRHLVRPGLSGLAQVSGRNALDWQNKFKLDVFYVDHLSFGLDIKIFLRTIKVVFSRRDVSSGTSVTMEEFKGNV